MSFEEKLFPRGVEETRRFQAACERVFNSEEGRVVLGMLCAAAHPLAPVFSDADPSALPAARREGQREVVACLWRFGGGMMMPAGEAVGG